MFKPCIYGLADPLEPEKIRYIGKARRSWRMKTHATETRNHPEYKTHKHNWIRKLQTEGRDYIVIILKEFEEDISDDLLYTHEVHFIAKYKVENHDLTNATDGGEGMRNPSPETRTKLRLAMTQERRNLLIAQNKSRIGEKASEKTRSKMRSVWTSERRIIGIASNKRRAGEQRSAESIQRIKNASKEMWAKPGQALKMSEAITKGKQKAVIARREKLAAIRALKSSLEIQLEDQICKVKARIKAHERVARQELARRDTALQMVGQLSQRLEDLQVQLNKVVA